MSLLAWSQAAPPLPNRAASGKTLALDPPGYTPDVSSSVSKKNAGGKGSSAVQAVAARSDPSALQLAKAWEVSYSPAKNLPMNAIMLYMSGNTVQIFSMMAVGMLFTGPAKGIASVEQTVALGIWKCWSMGLLPTESSDWLAWRQPRVPLEYTPLRA